MQETPAESQTLTVPQGTFRLVRYPDRQNLRPWDAADEYALLHLAEAGGPVGPVCLVNDGFGALACALADYEPVSWSDSLLAHKAARRNLVDNNIDPSLVQLWPVTTDVEPAEVFRTVIVKVPKTLALLEYQLRKLRPLLSPESVIIGAGMSKHVHTSTLALFEKILGPTTTSLAKKKARLSFTTFDPELDPSASPQPASYEFGAGLAAITLPGVYAGRRLDIGTRFLLEHLPTPGDGQRVLDLGCGNGIVGVSLAVANPACHVTFTDVSYLAMASARATHRRAFPEGRSDSFAIDDGSPSSEGHLLDKASIDLVVLNPPFHEQHVVGMETAKQMFADAKRVLRPGGELIVVANRNLGHHVRMNELFGNVKKSESNSKFVILRSVRP